MDQYLALKGVFIATFSLLKRSKSVYLTFIQRNSHYDIMAISVSLFSCHILAKKKVFCLPIWMRFFLRKLNYILHDQQLDLPQKHEDAKSLVRWWFSGSSALCTCGKKTEPNLVIKTHLIYGK